MAQFRREFLNEVALENDSFSDEEFCTRLGEYMERRGRVTAPAAAAPMETATAPSASIGMFMPSTAPELRGRENLAIFFQRIYTWACVTGCNSAFDSDLIAKTSGIPRAELERLRDRTLVHKSLLW